MSADPVPARSRPSGGRGSDRPSPLDAAVQLCERMLDRLESLRRVPDLVRAQIVLVRASRDLRTRETGRLLSLLREDVVGQAAVAREPEEAEASQDGPGANERDRGRELEEARRVGDAVRFVAEGGLVRTRCLARALAMKRLLDGRGLGDARIRVGVRESGGELLAHAWVEFRGHVVGDFPERVRSYTDLPGIRVHSDAAGEAGGRGAEDR